MRKQLRLSAQPPHGGTTLLHRLEVRFRPKADIPNGGPQPQQFPHYCRSQRIAWLVPRASTALPMTFPDASMPLASDRTKSGGKNACRSTALLAVPFQTSAREVRPSKSTQTPACQPAATATASDSQHPLGCRSTTLSAVPVQSRACHDPELLIPGPAELSIPPPTCWPPLTPKATDHAKCPLRGLRSMTLAALPVHKSA